MKHQRVVKKRKLDGITSLDEKEKSDKGTIPIHRGRFKQRYLRKHSSLLHNTQYVRGLLISANVGNETRALGQARMFIEHQIDSLFPHATPFWEDSGPKPLDIDLDILGDAEENAKRIHDGENGQIKGEKSADQELMKRDRRFQAVDTACAGLLFLRFRVSVTPTEFINCIFDKAQEMDESVWKTISHCHRFLPIEHVCTSDITAIQNAFQNLMDSYAFQGQAPTFCLSVEVRNRDTLSRKGIIDSLAAIIPSTFKIDLVQPKYTAVITVFKSVCGMSILEDYSDKKKMNLLQYVKPFNAMSALVE